MGYIQDNLMAGEKVVHEAKQHVIIYAGPFFVALLAFCAFLIPAEPLVVVCIAIVI